MDDFGSGYSSLNMLKDVAVNALKLDMRFLDIDAEKHNEKKGKGILKSVVSMSRQMELPIIVEGVENEKQENLWSFSIKVNRVVDGVEDIYIPSFKVKYYFPDTQIVKSVEDESKREGFVGCQDFLFELISEFLERNKRDLPLDWNMFWFGLDDLMSSCKYGEWVSDSDGYMDLASVDDENKENELYVECM